MSRIGPVSQTAQLIGATARSFDNLVKIREQKRVQERFERTQAEVEKTGRTTRATSKTVAQVAAENLRLAQEKLKDEQEQNVFSQANELMDALSRKRQSEARLQDARTAQNIQINAKEASDRAEIRSLYKAGLTPVFGTDGQAQSKALRLLNNPIANSFAESIEEQDNNPLIQALRRIPEGHPLAEIVTLNNVIQTTEGGMARAFALESRDRLLNSMSREDALLSLALTDQILKSLNDSLLAVDKDITILAEDKFAVKANITASHLTRMNQIQAQLNKIINRGKDSGIEEPPPPPSPSKDKTSLSNVERQEVKLATLKSDIEKGESFLIQLVEDFLASNPNARFLEVRGATRGEPIEERVLVGGVAKLFKTLTEEEKKLKALGPAFFNRGRRIPLPKEITDFAKRLQAARTEEEKLKRQRSGLRSFRESRR